MSKSPDKQLAQNTQPVEALEELRLGPKKTPEGDAPSLEQLSDTSFSHTKVKRKKTIEPSPNFNAVRSAPRLETLSNADPDQAKHQKKQASKQKGLSLQGEERPKTILDRLMNWVATRIENLVERLLDRLNGKEEVELVHDPELDQDLEESEEEELDRGVTAFRLQGRRRKARRFQRGVSPRTAQINEKNTTPGSRK